MRKPIIIGNWKMNMSIDDGALFISNLNKALSPNVAVGLAVQTIALSSLNTSKGNVLIGAQNVHQEETGAFTGETSVLLLDEIKADFCVIGHSERRQYFNETDEAINAKAKKLLQYNVLPVICVGETLAEYEANTTQSVIEAQIEVCTKDLDIANCVIAYEPVWAIGTGKSANAEIAQNVCALIRTKLTALFGADKANAVRIQYGGSVNENNIAEYMNCADIDGALVGGASLNLENFSKLINY